MYFWNLGGAKQTELYMTRMGEMRKLWGFALMVNLT